MPPKVDCPDERPSRLKLLFTSDKHNRAFSIDPASSRPETLSDQGSSKFNTARALRNTSKVLDALKTVSNVSSLLGPLGTTCDALKVVVIIAQVSVRCSYLVDVLIRLYHQYMVKNQEDLKDLLDKLHQQLDFIQDKTLVLTDSRFRPSPHSIQGLVKSLEVYILFVIFLNIESPLILYIGNWIRFKIRLTPKTGVECDSSFTRCLRWTRIGKRLIAVPVNWKDPSCNSWSVSYSLFF